MLEAVEGVLCLLEVLEVPDAMCCVLLCMLEAVEDGFSFGVSKFPLSPFSIDFLIALLVCDALIFISIVFFRFLNAQRSSSIFCSTRNCLFTESFPSRDVFRSIPIQLQSLFFVSGFQLIASNLASQRTTT